MKMIEGCVNREDEVRYEVRSLELGAPAKRKVPQLLQSILDFLSSHVNTYLLHNTAKRQIS